MAQQGASCWTAPDRVQPREMPGGEGQGRHGATTVLCKGQKAFSIAWRAVTRACNKLGGSSDRDHESVSVKPSAKGHASWGLTTICSFSENLGSGVTSRPLQGGFKGVGRGRSPWGLGISQGLKPHPPPLTPNPTGGQPTYPRAEDFLLA